MFKKAELFVKGILRKVIFRAMPGYWPAYVAYSKARTRRLASHYPRKPYANPPAGHRVIFMVDSLHGHSGGLTDRLRGMASMRGLCKERGWDFRIWFRTPFPLERYLVPAEYDWTTDAAELDFDHAEPVFAMDIRGGRSTEFGLRYITEHVERHPLCHVYTNLALSWEDFPALYRELFKPSPALEALIEQNTAVLGDGAVAAVLRFRQLLGDFYEGGEAYSHTLTPSMQEKLIGECLEKLARVRAENPQVRKILVTSDSSTFLARAVAAFEWVYTIPGRVVHMAFTHGEEEDVYMKSFVDFNVLAHCRKIYPITGPGMYRSGFPWAASLIGGAEYEEIFF